MRNCGWYLWLNGKKIYNIRELRENFDTAVLSGYFMGGSLMKWLSDLGEYTILRRLSDINTEYDIGTQLEFAFGVSPDKKIPADAVIKPLYPVSDISISASETGVHEVVMFSGSFTPFANSSFSVYSDIVSSFNSAVGSSFTSLTESSFGGFTFTGETASSFGSVSSYAAFVSGQALNMIQSSGSSFSFNFSKLFGLSGAAGSFANMLGGSFLNMMWWSEFFGSYGNRAGGSFRSLFAYSKWLNGSYKGIYTGSFLLSLLGGGSFMMSSGMYGSLPEAFFGAGSFSFTVGGVTITAEEYRRTLINLSSCPLNAYGYGINLV